MSSSRRGLILVGVVLAALVGALALLWHRPCDDGNPVHVLQAEPDKAAPDASVDEYPQPDSVVPASPAPRALSPANADEARPVTARNAAEPAVPTASPGPTAVEGASLSVLVLASGRPVANAEVLVVQAELSRATDATGRCRFADLSPGRFDVEVRSDQGLSATETTVVRGTNSVVIALRQAAAVHITVAEEREGEPPVAGALVSIDLPGRPRSGSTDADGEVRFDGVPPGRYSLRVTADGFAAHHGHLRVLPIEQGGDNLKTILLHLGTRVCGRVIDGGWQPVTGAQVWPVPHDLALGNGWGQCGPAGRSVITDASGRFCFPALLPGVYDFKASHSERGQGTGAAVTVKEQAVDNVDVVLAPGAGLSGRVETETGAPVAGALVLVLLDADSLLGPSCVGEVLGRATTDAAGEFAVAGLRPSKVLVRALAEEGVSDTLTVDLLDGDHGGVVLVVDDTGSIAGTVSDGDGSLVAGARVWARPPRDSGLGFSLEETTSDELGRFRFAGLSPGAWELAAAAPTVDESMWAAFSEGTRAQTGDQDVQLTLLLAGGVTGRVTRADGISPVTDFQVQFAHTMPRDIHAPDGRFEVSPFNAGTYRVKVLATCCADADLGEVVVEEGGTTDLGTIALKEGRDVTGIVLDEEGNPLAGATVRCGTQLIQGGSGQALPGIGNKAVSGADGSFRFAGMETVELAVQASHESGCRTATEVIPPGDQAATVELHCRSGASLSGELFIDEQPAAEQMVFLSVVGQHMTPTIARTSAGGEYRFDQVSAGNYTLMVLRLGGDGGHIVSTRVQLEPGDDLRKDIFVQTGPGTLTVQMPDGLECGPEGLIVTLFKGAFDLPEGGVEQLISETPEAEYWYAQVKDLREATFAALVPGTYSAVGVCVTDVRAARESKSVPDVSKTLKASIVVTGEAPVFATLSQ